MCRITTVVVVYALDCGLSSIRPDRGSDDQGDAARV
jgi:hypothetical protein